MITRDRGEPQSEIGIGVRTEERFNLPPGKPPVLSWPTIKEDLKKGEIEIHANSEKELRKVLESYKRKYPEIDVEKGVAAAVHQKEYFNQALNLKIHIGGPEAMKAIVKIAVNFYIYAQGKREVVKHLLPYLNGEEELDIVWMYHPEERVYKAEENEVPHVLKIIGDPKEGVLYAYVELLDAYSFMVLLNEDYTGEVIDIDYVFDVISQKTKKNVTELSLTKKEIKRIVTEKPFNQNQAKSRVFRIRQISNRLHDQRELDRIIRKAVKVFENEPSGEPISEKVKNEFFEQVSLDFAKLMLHKQNSAELIKEISKKKDGNSTS
ncbi:hypothetical protein GCM10022259_22880 [Aquimarina mytili]